MNKKSIFEETWLRVWLLKALIILAVIFGSIYFYFLMADYHNSKNGEYCLHHLHNLVNSADANLSDVSSVYGYGSKSNAEQFMLSVTAQCLITYPNYNNQFYLSDFNTKAS